MRLIDADALITKCGNWYTEEGTEEGFIGTVKQLLDEQPTVEMPGWISVQDRLPEKSAWYLVSLVNTRMGHRWKVPVPADYSHGKWDYAYLGEEDATWTQNNIVTHWMPLPEPPGEVSKNAAD